MRTSSNPPAGLPLVGRATEVEMIRALLASAEAGEGGTLILSGGSGVGKSRLLQTAAGEAGRAGWTTLMGRAYPVESGIPYAPFADAFVPLLRTLSPDALATLTRGGEAELGHLFPVLRRGRIEEPGQNDAVELKTRLLWNFAQFLGRLAARQPVLLILDDLQWADASSLELFHFVARQIADDRVGLLCAYNDGLAEQNPRLLTTEQSLLAIGAARSRSVAPLSHADTMTLIRHALGLGDASTREFAALLYGWTRGNPFFLEETLKMIAESGRVQGPEGVGRSIDLSGVELPKSVRDAVVLRLGALPADARALADLMAVVGTSVAHEVLRPLSGFDEPLLVRSLDELRRHRLLDERLEGESIIYDFTHPVVREALYAELGLARTRHLHALVAENLENYFGPAAADHAGELAYHYARSPGRDLAPKAVRYLAAAGREALRKFSNREAADYLTAALERSGESAGAGLDKSLLEDLARARQRLGDFEGAISLWRRLLELAVEEDDTRARARAHRRLGLVEYYRGNYISALEELDRGLTAAREADDRTLQARLHIARGVCSMELGNPEVARVEIEEALRLAERSGRQEVLARVHLVLLQLHTFTGPPEKARYHADQALRFAEELGDARLGCTVHWAASVLAGLTGDAVAIRRHLEAADALATQLRSPLHRLHVAEPAMEFLANTGDWERAVELGEHTVATARALNQRSLLARLLVWTGLIHIGRGDLTRGKEYVDEAWELSGAGRADQPPDVHTVVPAHVGRAAYHLAIGDYPSAIRIADAGLAIADRTGYSVWAIHRLLPTLGEAYLMAGDLDGAARTGARLRADSERLGHPLGLAWADACDALLVWLRGDIELGMERLSAAAERLEAIPAVVDAARLRRHFAARLRDHGAREAALRELRHIHEIFVRLGAERELAKTREQIRELGARPPAREVGRGVEGLTEREVEIAVLAARGKSNKTIGKVLGISPRTVSTHLSNIFAKMEIGSRGELVELVRKLDLADH